MKYDLSVIEKKWREFWQEEKINECKYDATKPVFSVDTPPPYVSADHLHAGHIMSYTQAEFIVRFKRMQGINVFYPMGFDDNGLPTERFVEKKHNLDKSKISRSEFIKLCLEETKLGAKTYRDLWDSLGISVDWSKTYSTISEVATKVSQWSIIDLYKKGALYRAENPILWCTSCRTAHAQADVEDKERDSKMNFISFLDSKEKKYTIATSRPELLPACVAVYVNPKDTRYKKIIGEELTVPIFGQKVRVMTNIKVDPEFGTGLMMVCTWGDQEDVEKWKEDKLDTKTLFTEDGLLNDRGGEYKNLRIEEARKKIIIELEKTKALERQEDIHQVVDVHERCGTPVEFILSKQWFIRLSDLKDVWLEYGKKLHWFPKEKEQDYILWVNSLKWDWCVSRQRYYGVPLPLWYCGKCDEPLFAEEKDLPVYPTELTPRGKKCGKCGNSELIPEKDVMDTWATSSCTPFLIREIAGETFDKSKLFPVTLRPNAFEIIRTWDFYSIVKSHYHFNRLPFKDVMISGHGLDEEGRKFSKRLGNYIPSNELIKKYNADPIRYWATGAMLGQNLRFSESEIEKGRKTVIKLWNVARFLEMNLKDFKKEEVPSTYEHADNWIINETNNTINKVAEAFEKYAYAEVRNSIDTLFWSKFTDYYVEFIKYRLIGTDITSKRAAQSTLHRVFLAILKMYAPIMPFITEELYQAHYRNDSNEKSIHISSWPEALTGGDSKDSSDFEDVIAVIDEIRKYKSLHNISLGSEIEEYKIETKIDIKKYLRFIQGVMKVKKIL